MATMKAFAARPVAGARPARAARAVSVRASGGAPKEPVKFENIPASERVFSDAQWNDAINKASGKITYTGQVAGAKAVTVGEAFAFAGPLPETANGRLAMLGFAAALGAEISTQETVFTQFSEAPAAILGTVVAFTIASLVPILKGANLTEAFGPLTPAAEKLNGRAAMIGLAALLALEYTQGKPLF